MRGAYDIITAWNKWRNPDTNKDEWFRHVIPGCSWEHKVVRDVSGQTASVASVFSVLISENQLFVPSKEWAAGDKAAFFTLQTGDLAALGDWEIDITGVSPFRESDVRQSLMPEVFTVRVFKNNAAGYKRGRHYYIEGV